MVWFIPIPSATSPYPHQIIAQGYPVQSCQRAADPEWFIFSGPAYVLSAIAILPQALVYYTVYIVQHTVEAARGLDAPYHGIENLILMWDGHVGLERPDTQNGHVKITVHFSSVTAIPPSCAQEAAPRLPMRTTYCAGDETCF